MLMYFPKQMQWSAYRCTQREASFSGSAWRKATAVRAKRNQRGFSLLELLVVVALMGIVAIGSVTLLVDDGDWKRQQETELRWDALRKAILSEPNLMLNGQPYRQGYVIDMGRLPISIVELLRQSETTATFDHDGNSATAALSVNQPAWTGIDLYAFGASPYTTGTGYSGALHGGWRGPYLYTAGSRAYRDAWDNVDTNANTDLFNFGWQTTLTGGYPDVTDLAVQSLGADNRNGGNDDYSLDFPVATQPLITQNEWLLGTEPITFDIVFSRPVSSATLPAPNVLELRIYRYMDNGDATADVNDIEEEVADSTFTLNVNDTTAPVQTITPLTQLAAGRFAAVLWCTNNTSAVTSDDTVYDGDCDATYEHHPYFFTLIPGVQHVTLRWNLP